MTIICNSSLRISMEQFAGYECLLGPCGVGLGEDRTCPSRTLVPQQHKRPIRALPPATLFSAAAQDAISTLANSLQQRKTSQQQNRVPDAGLAWSALASRWQARHYARSVLPGHTPTRLVGLWVPTQCTFSHSWTDGRSGHQAKRTARMRGVARRMALKWRPLGRGLNVQRVGLRFRIVRQCR
jgi:hypothetical protein